MNFDHHAVIIGIGQYPGYAHGRNVRSDAEALAAWLRAADGGGMPDENLHLLVSDEAAISDPSTAHPQQHEVRRAFEYLGLGSGQRIGKRLYLSIAGQAVGSPDPDQLSVLTAEATPQRPAGFDLADLLAVLRRGAFDELVVLVELAVNRVPLPRPPPLLRHADAARPPPREFRAVLLHFEQGAVGAGDHRSSLVNAWLKAVRSVTRDTHGRVTAPNIASSLPALATGPAKIRPQLEIKLADADDMLFGPRDDGTSPGRLEVEVPLWAATVRVTSLAFQTATELTPTDSSPDGKIATFAGSVPPGLYRIEASLDDSMERQIAEVRPGAIARIGRNSWKKLKLTAAMPLAAASPHVVGAQTWSHKSTWNPLLPERTPAGARSQLFLFLRTQQRARPRNFPGGLRLLNGRGELVTDFTDGVEVDHDAGFMAFNACLEPGPYILSRGGRKVARRRQQPIFLHDGWATQVFVAAAVWSSLGGIEVHMTKRGDGFSCDDPSAIAAHAAAGVLCNDGPAELLERDQVADLLREPARYPWLAILAAHILSRALRKCDAAESSRRQGLSAKIRNIVTSLAATLPEHPDVRALALDDGSPAERPFTDPPMLSAGLKLVQRHAVMHRGTISLDSLTDCVLGHQIMNGPWTAWRALGRLPREFRSGAEIAIARRKEDEPTASKAAVQSAVSDVLSPAAPIFRLGAEELPSTATARQSASLLEAAVIGKARALMEDVATGAVAPVVETVDSSLLVYNLSPEDLSQRTGMSLDSIYSSLDRLRSGSSAVGEAISTADTAVEHAALATAARAAAGIVHAFVGHGAEADPTGATAAPTPITLEEVSAGLRRVAARLVGVEGVEQATPRREQLSDLSGRLQASADRLLEGAQFVIVSDEQGRFTFGNGAVRELLAVASPLQAHLTSVWESALKQAPLGRSKIDNPLDELPRERVAEVAGPAVLRGRRWILHRTKVTDDAGHTTAYVNILRAGDERVWPPQVVLEINSILPHLNLSSVQLAHEPESPDAYSTIASLTGRIEAAQAAGPI